jgi:hypothetical protein
MERIEKTRGSCSCSLVNGYNHGPFVVFIVVETMDVLRT